MFGALLAHLPHASTERGGYIKACFAGAGFGGYGWCQGPWIFFKIRGGHLVSLGGSHDSSQGPVFLRNTGGRAHRLMGDVFRVSSRMGGTATLGLVKRSE